MFLNINNLPLVFSSMCVIKIYCKGNITFSYTAKENVYQSQGKLILNEKIAQMLKFVIKWIV